MRIIRLEPLSLCIIMFELFFVIGVFMLGFWFAKVNRIKLNNEKKKAESTPESAEAEVEAK